MQAFKASVYFPKTVFKQYGNVIFYANAIFGTNNKIRFKRM